MLESHLTTHFLELTGYLMQAFTSYVPMDRRHYIAHRESNPIRTKGAALFVDISGFTPLTETLAAELGRKRGAEEVLQHINPIYDSLITQIHLYSGSVIGFAGDAMTCWFDDNPPSGSTALNREGAIRRAVTTALAMQEQMTRLAITHTPAGTPINLGIKVAVVSGPATRMSVGDPDFRKLEVVAGETINLMSAAEQQAITGEVVVSEGVVEILNNQLHIVDWRQDSQNHRFAIIDQLNMKAVEFPWLSSKSSERIEEQLEPWLHREVVNRIQTGGQFVGDLRAVTPIFLKFGGIDYDNDSEAAEKLDAYVRWVQKILAQYEGNLIQLTVGDKGSYMYAAFGALLAHEDDTLRALMAALTMREPPAEIMKNIGPVQIGITQGQVWTGDLGSSTRHDYAVMGNWVNMAARLMIKANPGQILISKSVAEAVEGRIRCRTLGDIQVKGRETPLAIAEAVMIETERHLAEQFDLEMVGRTDELNKLLILLDEVKAGGSRVVTIEADAGLGKSRLVAAWAENIRLQGLHGFLGAAQSIEQHTPYRAWRDLLSSFLDLDNLTSLKDQQIKVKTRIHASAPDSTMYIPLLNDILDLELPDNEMTKGLTARGRQQALITFLLKLFQTAADQSPLLLVLEDAHWLDVLSWDLALQLARGLEAAKSPFLLLLVMRPMENQLEAAFQLRQLSYSHNIHLSFLSAEAIEAVIANHLKVEAKSIPIKLVSLINKRSEGNPFFAEEILQNLLASGVVTTETDPIINISKCTLRSGFDQTAATLPESLQGVILARIDRLPPTQQLVLKYAAVIGRVFSMAPLNYLFRHHQTEQSLELTNHIALLEEHDFILTEAIEPELIYLFKHIIIREVAYDTLLFEQRRYIHLTLAKWYEQEYKGNTADSPFLPLLVFHYHQAEDEALEQHYTYLAGLQAAARYANDDALAYLNRALELAQASDKREQFKVLQTREEIHNRLGRRKEQETDLSELMTISDSAEERITVLLRYAAFYTNTGEYEIAAGMAEKAYQLAEEHLNEIEQAQALIHSGRAYTQLGEYESSGQYYQRAYKISQRSASTSLTVRAIVGLGQIAFRQGDYPTAKQYHQQALSLWKELDDWLGQGRSLQNLGQVANAQGEYDIARECFDQALLLIRQIGDRPHEGRLLCSIGENEWGRGAYKEAEEFLQQSLSMAQTTGDKNTMAAALKLRGSVAIDMGKNETARDFLERSLTICQEIGDRVGEGKALNNLGIFFHIQGRYEKVQSYYEQTLVIAREIGDLAMECKTLSNLGVLSKRQGRYEQAEISYRQSLKIAKEIGHKATEIHNLINLGNLLYNQSDFEQSKVFYFQSLSLCRETSDLAMEGITLSSIGAVFLEQNAFKQAQSYLEQALEIHRGLNQPHYISEDLAILSLSFLRQGKLEDGISNAEQLLSAWSDNPTFKGASNPMMAIHIAWQVFKELKFSQADELLNTAVKIMQEYLDNQPDLIARDKYLQQPHHQELWKEGQKKNCS